MGSSRSMLFLVLGLVCSSNFLIVESFDFNLPNVDDIKALFGSIAHKIKSAAEETAEEIRSDDMPHERLKRQTSNIGDESPNPYEVISSSLPMNPDGVTINTRYMPTLGNGYLGLTVYDDSMFINGVYSGTGGQSHRAKIPALLMTKVALLNQEMERRATRKYSLNAKEGYFMEKVDCEYATIYHKIYLHQKYIRLLVVDTFAVLKPNVNGGLTIILRYPSENSTDDVTWQGKIPYLGGSWQYSGTTKSSEAGDKTQNVYIFTTDPLVQIQVSGSNWIVNVTQVMAVDRVAANARQEFDAAQRILQQPRENNPNWQLFQEHANAWRNTWANGLVEVQGNDNQLNKAVWFAQYYLMSSLPSENPFLPPLFSDLFYGLGRTGLGKGSLGKDYQGHVMYDNEYYLMPAVLPFHPFLVKAMLRYRSALAKSAAANAKLYKNGVGYHYPWESGTSGADVTPDSCPAGKPNCYWNRLFVTAGVSYGIRMYYSLTRDRDYMVNTIYSGCDVSREVAKFLAGQAIYNPEHGRYDMDDITGPDDSHPHVNNNAFTLAAASLAIHYARYFSCLCQRNERDEIPDEYIQKAMYLNMPFDNVKRLHNQFQGFDAAKDTPIKQADAIMLNYPLNWNYSIDIMKNDLMFYETLMTDRTPAMTWSWFTIGWKWVGEVSKMRTYFLKSYQDYIVQPFKIWTEYTERNPSDQAAGNVNFLPGMGAFIQSIVYGFAGFRIRPDKLEVHNPQPPPGSNTIVMTNFYYLGSNLTFTITADKTVIQVLASSPLYPLLLLRNTSSAVEETLKTGAKVTVDRATSNGFFIYTTISETCEHPRDYIFMPWGYSPWINSSPGKHCPVWHVVMALVTSLMAILLTAL